jgi:hypothetical protein
MQVPEALSKKGTSMREEHPKIVDLKELRETREYDPWSVAIRVEGETNWFWRVLYWVTGRLSLARAVIELKREVINLRAVRIAGLRESDQAGALGLQLYAENEYLKSQLDRLDPEEYKESRDFYRESWMGAAKEYERLQREHEGLQRAHNNLLRDYEEFLERVLPGKK